MQGIAQVKMKGATLVRIQVQKVMMVAMEKKTEGVETMVAGVGGLT